MTTKRISSEELEARVKNTLPMLNDAETKISEIANSIGTSTSTYGRVFRRIYGKTPTEHRLYPGEDLAGNHEDQSLKSDLIMKLSLFPQLHEALSDIVEECPDRTLSDIADLVHDICLVEKPTMSIDEIARLQGLPVNLLNRAVWINRSVNNTRPSEIKLRRPAYGHSPQQQQMYGPGTTMNEFNPNMQMSPQPQRPNGRTPRFPGMQTPTGPQPMHGIPGYHQQQQSPFNSLTSELNNVDQRTMALTLICNLLRISIDKLKSIVEDIRYHIHTADDVVERYAAQHSVLPENLYLAFITIYGKTPMEYKLDSSNKETVKEREESKKQTDMSPGKMVIEITNHSHGHRLGGIPTTQLKMSIEVNKRYVMEVHIEHDSVDLSTMSITEFINSEYRDEFNQLVVEKLSRYFHGRLDISYIPSTFGHPIESVLKNHQW